MSRSVKRRIRKHRRKTRAVLAHGPDAAPSHKSVAGRTGRIHWRKIASRKA